MTTLNVATYSQIMTMLSQLATNYTSIFTDYYNIFINPEPMDITLQIYDEAGNLTTITIPNRAKDRTYILNGEGDPNNSKRGAKGSLYQDTANGVAYINLTGRIDGWSVLISESELANYIRQGAGSPEGLVGAPKGVLYIDNINAGLYMKTTETGNTGWTLISVSTALLANTNLSNLTEEGEAHFADPSLSNLNETGIGVLTAKENTSNKILEITPSVDNTQYPSARATYNYVENAVEPLANRDMSNLTEDGEYYVATKNQMRDCVLAAPNGVAQHSGNVITFPLGVTLFGANGLDENKKKRNVRVTTTGATVNSVSWNKEQKGVLFYDITNGQLRYCTEESYFRVNETPDTSDPLAVWYNTDTNVYFYRNSGNWVSMVATEIARFTTNKSGNIDTWDPFYPVSLVTEDELETFTKKMVTESSTTFEYLPSGEFVKNDVVFVDSLNSSFDPSTTDHPDAVWLYSTPVFPYVPMNLTNSGTSYTFTNGGMVVCLSATNVTLNSGELVPVTFTGFVGILPVSVGTVVTTSKAAYFVGY